MNRMVLLSVQTVTFFM